MNLKKFATLTLAVSGIAFSQSGNTTALDVIIRDFPVGEYGFEEFDAIVNGDNGKCAENNKNKYGGRISNWNQTNAICYNGDKYGSCDKIGGKQLRYGQNDYTKTAANGAIRGFCNGPDKNPDFGNYNCENPNAEGSWGEGNRGWSNSVGVTKGMVQTLLNYDDCSKEEKEEPQYLNGRYCAKPKPNNGQCYGEYLDEWFSKNGKGKEITDVLTLTRVSGTIYEISYDYNTREEWNNGYSDNGYFPLDKYDDSQTYGKQSLNIGCVPKNYRDKKSADDADYADCMKWIDNGGPTDPNAAVAIAEFKNKLHNYGFTMAGSGEFKYVEGAKDIFEFVGDDDMWIFIDGELVDDADLGGIHIAAPAKIDIADYASLMKARGGEYVKRWENGSKHAINFYYADRQTDGSNLKLRMSLSDLSPARFGAPRILEAKTVLKQGEEIAKTTIYVNSKLGNISDFLGQFPIIVIKGGNKEVAYGYRLDYISEPEPAGSKGYAYQISGKVCTNTDCSNTENTVLNSGDSLSFNAPYDYLLDGGVTNTNNFELQNDTFIENEKGVQAKDLAWGANSSSLPPIQFVPEPGDKDPVKPPFNVEQNFTGSPDGSPLPGSTLTPGAGSSVGSGGIFPGLDVPNVSTANGKDNGKGENGVHGFGTAGTPIPPSRAGELILTAYPNASGTVDGVPYAEWEKGLENNKVFGLPPKVANGGENGEFWGVADPTVSAEGGGYQFVKNGFPGESSTMGVVKLAPTRCTADISDPDKPRINCLNFSLDAKQPFDIAVTIYDQLGNFVTQYRESISEQEFRNVTQASAFVEGTTLVGTTACKAPSPNKDNYGDPETLTTNGMVRVNVNIYPFSTNGRRFGNGVYIAKIDRVDRPFSGCTNVNGSLDNSPNQFTRYHAEQKFGWMRSSEK